MTSLPEPHTLVFATEPGVGNQLTQRDEAIQQLELYLLEQLGTPVRLLLSENYEALLAELAAGTIDIAAMGPYAFALAQARSGARTLVNTVETTATSTEPRVPHRSMLFTQADSGISHLAQLKGQRVGFVDPRSTSGYLVATFLLQQAGIDATTDIEPVFFFSHPAVVKAVCAGEVSAGVAMAQEFQRHVSTGDAPTLRLLATSPILSPGMVVVRPDFPHPLERKLISALEHVHHLPGEAARLLLMPDQHFVPAVQRARSLKMVAELAGVSYATVSRAINGRDRIAPATAERILRLVEELGYQPNADARGLHHTQGNLVGLLLPTLNYPQLDPLVQGLQRGLAAEQIQLLLCPVGRGNTPQTLELQKTYFSMLSNSRFAGTILTQWSTQTTLAIDLTRSGYPSVLLEQDLLEDGLKTVWRWLSERGHQQVGVVVGSPSFLEPLSLYRACERLAPYHLPLLDLARAPDTSLQILEDCTALICSDTTTALTVRQHLATEPLLLSLEDSALARWTHLPHLTFDGVAAGRTIALRLLKMLNLGLAKQVDPAHFWIQD